MNIVTLEITPTPYTLTSYQKYLNP